MHQNFRGSLGKSHFIARLSTEIVTERLLYLLQKKDILGSGFCNNSRCAFSRGHGIEHSLNLLLPTFPTHLPNPAMLTKV